MFDRVQNLISQRAARRGYSGVTIFSSRIQCGHCGGWYGSKVWHSNDKYRRVVWQCNAKFKDKRRCPTPHLSEDEIKAAFVRMANTLITDRSEIPDELREIQSALTDTKNLERERDLLAERMNADADAVQRLIAENARVAQNQEQYAVRYDALVSQFEETKAAYESVTAGIAAKEIRRREIDRFIKAVEELPQAITDFSDALWGSLVDHITVYSKADIRFTLTSGTEVKIV